METRDWLNVFGLIYLGFALVFGLIKGTLFYDYVHDMSPVPKKTTAEYIKSFWWDVILWPISLLIVLLYTTYYFIPTLFFFIGKFFHLIARIIVYGSTALFLSIKFRYINSKKGK